jgi:anti-anti-sigma regulatory factor
VSFAVRLRGPEVLLEGEADLTGAQDLSEVLHAVEEGTTGAVTVRLEDCEFLDVAGARSLAAFAHRLRAAGRGVTLTGHREVTRLCLRAFGLELGVRT